MEEKSDLKVKLGDIVQLQYIAFSDRERLNAKVIGYAPNKSLILSAPVVMGSAPFLQEKQKFIVRMMRGSQVYAFESVVLKYLTSPYSHVHMSQPEKIEAIQVRNARRVNTEIIISVQKQGSDNQLPATMLNTSLTGALIKTDKPLAENGDQLVISAEFVFNDFQKYLRLNAIVRNVTVSDNNETYRYGVEFQNLDNDQKLILHGYVYDLIVREMEE